MKAEFFPIFHKCFAGLEVETPKVITLEEGTYLVQG